jgi:hypothetical protein
MYFYFPSYSDLKNKNNIAPTPVINRDLEIKRSSDGVKVTSGIAQPNRYFV